MDEQTLRKLRSKLDKALAANQPEEAIRLLTQLSAADSANARWPHKQGDLLRKLERYRDAAIAYAAAADLYAEQGFLSRAVAVAKTVANLDPRRLDVLERIDPDAAKQFRRNLRPPTQPLRQAPPAAVQERVTNQGFVRGPVSNARTGSAASNAGVSRPSANAKTGAVSGPARDAGAEALARAAADTLARTVAASGAGPTVSKRPAADRTAQPLPAVPQRLTMPGRRHPMVLDDDEPVPAPARPGPPSRQQSPATRAPTRVEPVAPPPPARTPTRVEPVAPPPPARTPTRVEPVAPRPDASSTAASKPTSEDDEIIVVILDDDEVEPASEVAPAAAAAGERPQPSAAATTPATRTLSLDRLSVPPPRQDRAGATDSAAAPRGIERTSPSPLPPRPARAIELAPPAELGDAETLELPTGKVMPLQAAQPARRRSEPSSRTAGDAPEPRAGGAVEARSLEAEWSAESAEEFSRALEAAAPASIRPRAAADVEAASCVDARDALLRLPLFAKLDAQTLGELAAGSTLIELNDGASLVRRGEVSDTLFGIIRGSARLSGPERSYELELAPGDLFGEACVLKHEPCRADVRVAGQLRALKIPRTSLARLLKRKPRVADQLLGLLTSRLRLAVLAGSPLFRELDPDSRQELGARFEVRRASAGSRLAEQDVPIEGLYVLLTGQLTVEKSGFVSMVAPALSLFGHQLLVSAKRSPSTITARRNVVLLRLPASAFGEVALRCPRFAARLAKQVSSDVVPLD